MLKFAYQLTKQKKYKDLEEDTRKLVKEKFWNGKWLADGLNDYTIRPNVFIAAYIYPELLTKKEWKTCFKNILPKLWLKWGGLASLQKDHPLFQEHHTGEIPQSYHRGDSWYWINNLSALVLRRVDRKEFSKYIQKITEASTNEILIKGTIGHHAEVSSAGAAESQGCTAQAWSNAMFIELVEES